MQEKEDFPAVQDFIDAKEDGRTGSAAEQAAVLAEIMQKSDFPDGRIVDGKRYTDR
jgi:hypothetical protein